VLTEKPQGLGMGLAISSRIVEMHRGRLWVEEGPRGVGSVFVMELPVKPPNC
jgi:signal transduction histidine kinase